MKTATEPLLVKRAAGERGRTQLSWLDSWHTFSFGDYDDPEHVNFRSLRVINDDVVLPGNGFGTHPHRDAEIFTYVVEGQLAHKDSMGNGSIIRPGNLQYMSAGSGVEHSEFNPSPEQPVHLLQIWILPNVRGGEPRYAEKPLGRDAKPDSLTLLFAGKPRDGAIAIRQDAEVSFGKLSKGRSLSVEIGAGRGVWIHVIRGRLGALDEKLGPGDGAAISNAPRLELSADQDAEFLYFDLA